MQQDFAKRISWTQRQIVKAKEHFPDPFTSREMCHWLCFSKCAAYNRSISKKITLGMIWLALKLSADVHLEKGKWTWT